jgi:hypothetical protein
MTVSALAPRTGTTPAADVVAAVHALLDGVAVVGGAVDADLLVALDRAISRLQSLRLGLVAAADEADVAAGTGLPRTSAWPAVRTRVHAATAARDLTRAKALDDEPPMTSAARADAALSSEHAVVIARTTELLPADPTAIEKSAVEAHLVDTARRTDPHRLRRVARTALPRPDTTPPRWPRTAPRSCATKKQPPAARPGSPCTTTRTAPPPGTSPSRPLPRSCCARSSRP